MANGFGIAALVVAIVAIIVPVGFSVCLCPGEPD
jgi:hypothetical protein